MGKLLKNIYIKAILLAGLPIVMTIVDQLTGMWHDTTTTLRQILGNKWLYIVIVIIYIALIVYYAYLELIGKKEQKDMEKLERQLAAYDEEIKSITAIFDFSQTNINKITKNLTKTSKLDLREWNIEMIATSICVGVYDTLSKIAAKGQDFTVNIYIRQKDSNGEYATMIAHEGEYKKQVKIFGKKIRIDTGSKKYYSIKQFVNNNPDESILVDWCEIKKKFKFNGNSDKYKDEYSQYVGVPVCCREGNVIALLEIIAHKGSLLGNNVDDIRNMINRHLRCFQYFILMAIKVQKNMESKAAVLNEEE